MPLVAGPTLILRLLPLLVELLLFVTLLRLLLL